MDIQLIISYKSLLFTIIIIINRIFLTQKHANFFLLESSLGNSTQKFLKVFHTNSKVKTTQA